MKTRYSLTGDAATANLGIVPVGPGKGKLAPGGACRRIKTGVCCGNGGKMGCDLKAVLAGAKSGGQGGERVQKKKVIVVLDDEPIIAKAIGRIAMSAGAEACITRTVDEAVEAIKKGADLAIVDYRLTNNRRGTDVVERLMEEGDAGKEMAKKVVIYSSAPHMLREEIPAIAKYLAENRIIEKPAEQKALISLIRHVCRGESAKEWEKPAPY
jgi:CheY-like chemotaxis protein